MLAWSVRLQMFEAVDRLLNGRQMALGQPPHHHVTLLKLLEPLVAAAVKALVHGLPDKPLERCDVPPYRHVHSHAWIAGVGPRVGGVAAIVLVAPHEALAALGEPVDEGQVVDKIRHLRIADLEANAPDVQLREVVVGRLLHRLPRCNGFYGIAPTGVVDAGLARIFVDAPLDLRTEVAEQALHRPDRTVTEGADGVALDLL